MISAEIQNATMAEERAFASKLFESALQGRTADVQSTLLEYSAKKHVAPLSVLSQFRDASKRTVIHFACMSVNDSNEVENDIVIQLLSPSAGRLHLPPAALETLLRMKDKDGLTPLMLAAQNIPIPPRDPDTVTSAEEALRYSRANQIAEARIRAIVDKGGPKVGLARSHAGATALHYAASRGASSDILNILFQIAPVAVRTRSLRGGQPLHWAAGVAPPANFTHTMQTLLDNCGADIDASDKDEGLVPHVLNLNPEQDTKYLGAVTPCLLAAAAANDVHAKYLLQKGARRDVLLPGNITLFHMAADLNLVGTLAVLLQDTQPDIISTCLSMKTLDKQRTPLDMAVLEGHIRCVMLLIGEPDEDKTRSFMQQHRSALEQDLSSLHSTPNTNEVVSHSHTNTLDSFSEEAAQIHVQSLLSTAEVSEEKKILAHQYKIEGNAHFANKDYQLALESYTHAISTDPSDETFYSNRSACFMAMDKPNPAFYDASIARLLKPNWAKGYYRLAVSQLSLERFEAAAVSAWEGLRLEPDNTELKSLLQKCVKKGRKEYLENVK